MSYHAESFKKKKWFYDPIFLVVLSVILTGIISLFISFIKKADIQNNNLYNSSETSTYTNQKNKDVNNAGRDITIQNYYYGDKVDKEYTREEICNMYYNCGTLGGPGNQMCVIDRAEDDEHWGGIIKCKGVKTFLEMNPNIIIN